MGNSKINCFLIDDDDDDRLIFKSTIEKYFPDYQLSAFSSFEKSEPFFSDADQSPSVVFMDLNMPRINGLSALKILREGSISSDVPVVIYSTSNNPDDVNKCLKAGATAFITKPSTIAELVEEIGIYLKNTSAVE